MFNTFRANFSLEHFRIVVLAVARALREELFALLKWFFDALVSTPSRSHTTHAFAQIPSDNPNLEFFFLFPSRE